MPSSSGGSYSSLGASEIYRPTTVAGVQASGFLDGVKKAFQFVSGGGAPMAAKKDQLEQDPRLAVISRYGIKRTRGLGCFWWW